MHIVFIMQYTCYDIQLQFPFNEPLQTKEWLGKNEHFGLSETRYCHTDLADP